MASFSWNKFRPGFNKAVNAQKFYAKEKKKREEEQKTSPRIVQRYVLPTKKAVSGTKTDGGSRRTYQWERDMLHDLPKSYGRNYNDKLKNYLKRDHGFEDASVADFRVYMDSKEGFSDGKGKKKRSNLVSKHWDEGEKTIVSYGNQKIQEMREREANKGKEDDKKTESEKLGIKKDRSVLDRIFDTLLVGNYTSAGYSSGLMEDFKKHPFRTALNSNPSSIAPNALRAVLGGKKEGNERYSRAWEGMKASNPFGKGNEKGEYTYSKNLEQAGWKPKGTAGKIAKGTTGFVLDVALDPTTYATFGGSALLKGTGKVGANASLGKKGIKSVMDEFGIKGVKKDADSVSRAIYTKTIDEGRKRGLSHVEADKLARQISDQARTRMSVAGGEMTEDMARSIITEHSKARKYASLTDEELTRDSQKLVSEFNRLRGIRQNPKGGSLSLKNAPFGEWMYGKNSKLSKLGGELRFGSGDTLAKIGDRIGTAKAYSKLRNHIYGGRIGKLFSTNSGLYKLSKSDPAQLYDVMKFADYTKGLNADKIGAEKAIRDFTKQLDLSPADNKELVQALQNPSIWKHITKQVKASDTAEFKRYKEMLKASSLKAGNEVNQVFENRNVLEQMRSANEQGVLDAQEEIKMLQDEFNERLGQLDTTHITDQRQLRELNKQYAEEIKRLEGEIEYFRNANPAETTLDATPFKEKLMEWEEQINLNKAIQEGTAEGERTNSKKFELVDLINKHVFPEGQGIGQTAPTGEVKKLIKMLEDGKSVDEVRRYTESKPVYFNGQMKEIQGIIGDIMGYGDKMKNKSIEDMYFKPLEEFTDKIKNGVELSAREEQELARLQQVGLQYRSLTGKLYGMNPSQFQNWKREYANQKMWKDFNEVNPRLNPSEQAPRGELKRGEFNQTPTDALDGKKPYSTTITPEDHDEIMHNIMNMMAVRKNAGGRLDAQFQAGAGEMRYATNVFNETQDLLTNHFGKKYSDMSEPQKNLLVKMATQNVWKNQKGVDPILAKGAMKEAKKRAELDKMEAIKNQMRPNSEIIFKGSDGETWKGTVKAIDDAEDGVKYQVEDVQGNIQEIIPGDVREIKKNGKIASHQELIEQSDITKDYLAQIDELNAKRLETREQFDSNTQRHIDTTQSVNDHYYERLNDTHKRIEKLEKEGIAFRDTLESMDIAKAEQSATKLVEVEKALVDDDALETYVRAQLGDDRVNKWVANEKSMYDANVGDIMFKDVDVNDKVKELSLVLRGKFNEMGLLESQRGYLNDDAFRAMMERYLPHIATPEGARLFKNFNVTADEAGNLIKTPKAIDKKGVSVTQDLGYGQKWNPHGQERTIKNIQMPDGTWVENPTIEQINESLSPILKGKNAFSESVADIYLARAMKHTELMYDWKYMHEMMDVFGKPVKQGEGIEEGHQAVVNYGLLKNRINGEVRQTKKANKTLSQEKALSMVLDAYGLDAKVLDVEAVPMLQLNEKQINAFLKRSPDLVRSVNDVIVNKANQARQIQMTKDNSKFLSLYDKFTHFMKLNQTTIMPSFHMRNYNSNNYLNWLGVGFDAVRVSMQRDAWKTAHALGDAEKLKDLQPIVNDKGDVWHWNEIYEQTKIHDGIDEGFFARDIGATNATTGIKGGKLDPTDTNNFAPYRLGGKIGNKIENQSRLVHIASKLKQGSTMEEAVASSKKYLFDYSDLTRFEQNVMKRVFPYYTWLRKNGRLQASEIFEQPGKYRDTAKALNSVEGGVNEEDKVDKGFMSDFVQDWQQTGFMMDSEDRFGNSTEEPVMWNPNLPFMDLARLPDPSRITDSAVSLFSQMNPAIKVPTEQALNKNFFFDAPIHTDNKKLSDSENAKQEAIARLMHAGGQLAGVTGIEGAITKGGVDKGLHLLNIASGQKLLSYDYETSKRMTKAEHFGKYEPETVPVDKVLRGMREMEEEKIPDLLKGQYYKRADTLALTVDKWLSDDLEEKDIPKSFKPIISMAKEMGVTESGAKRFTSTVLDASSLDGIVLGKDFESGKVKEVIDGDTFRVKFGKKERNVRLLLVDTPETVDPDIDVEMPYGKKASNFTKEQLEGQDVRLVIDSRQKDAHGRILAYVYHDREDFNKKVLDKGLGRVRYADFDDRAGLPQNWKEEEYYDTQKRASKRKAGIWSVGDGYAGDPDKDEGYKLKKAKERYKSMKK